jgi:hypothetical protein
MAVLSAAICAVAGCGFVSADSPAQAVSDRLEFGRVIVTGGAVTDSQWRTFLDEVITPRLPDGFAVTRGEGQWRANNGAILRDSGFILEVVHPPGTPPDSVFEAIAIEYCRRFRQESVLRVRSPAQQWLYRAK